MIKRQFSIGLLISVVLLSSSALSQSNQSRSCKVKAVIGTVKVRRGNATTWADARVGLPLRETDAVRTFVESEAELETSEGSVLKVGENSTLEMSTLKGSSGTQETKVRILNGSVLSNVKKLAGANSKFEFETPTATAAIRGTVVGLDVSRERTEVRVYEGRVVVTPAGASEGAELKENEMTLVEDGQKSIKIERFDAKSPAVRMGTPADSSKDSTAKAPATVDSTRDSAQTRPPEIDTAKSSSTMSGSVRLALTSPADGLAFAPGEQISISGTCSPAGAKLLVAGKPVTIGAGGAFRTVLTAPDRFGDFELLISAEYGGSTQSASRRYAVIAKTLLLSVNVPRDGQVFTKPLIPVSGTATAGSIVTVAGIKIPVAASGTFSGQVPIPDEQTELQLEIEAALGAMTQKSIRRIVYQPEFRFVLTMPQDRQIINSTLIQVRGEVMPATAEVVIMGRKMQVLSAGSFSGFISIPDEEGEVKMDIEVSVGGKIRTETRTITYKRPPDTYRPILQGDFPAVSTQRRLTFTVLDRTLDDEITFHREIDGMREMETGSPNTPFPLVLLDGIHQYAVYAVDKAGNQSQRLAGKISYLESSVWRIRMRKPLGDEVVHLPPSAPGSDFKPRYTVEFSVENLPDDNIGLIREASVTNRTTGETVAQRTFTDRDLEFDIELDRKQPNVIVVQVVDTNNQTKTAQLRIYVR